MSITGPGDRITHKCTYCGAAIASFYDPYRFTDICPSCHGSVLIPRRSQDNPGATVPNSGEFNASDFSPVRQGDSKSEMPAAPMVPPSHADMPAVSAEIPQPPPAASAPQPPVEQQRFDSTWFAPPAPPGAPVPSAPPAHDEAKAPADNSSSAGREPGTPDTPVVLHPALKEMTPIPAGHLQEAHLSSEPKSTLTVFKAGDLMRDELVRAYGSQEPQGAPAPAAVAPPSPPPKEEPEPAAHNQAPVVDASTSALPQLRVDQPATPSTPDQPGVSLPLHPGGTTEGVVKTEGMEVRSDPGSSSLTPASLAGTQIIDGRPTERNPAILVPLAQPPIQPPARAYTPEDAWSDRSVSTPRRSSRIWLVAASLLIVLGAAAYIGNSLVNDMRRTERENAVAARITEVDLALKARDLNAADAAATQAQELIDSASVPLTDRRVLDWKAQINTIHSLHTASAQIQSVYADAQTDPDKTRNELEAKKHLYERDRAEGAPILVKQIDDRLADLDRLVAERKEQRLAEDVKVAEAIYQAGKIEDAAKKALEIVDALVRKPAVAAPELQKRAETLIERLRILEKATAVRQTAKDDKLSDARKKIQNEIGRFEPKNEIYKPLVARLKALDDELAKAETIRDDRLHTEKVARERNAHKIAPAEEKMLSGLLAGLQSVDAKFHPGKADGDGVIFEYGGRDYRLGLRKSLLAMSLFVETGENKVELDMKHFEDAKKGESPKRPIRVIRHAMALGDAMKAAKVSSDELWDAHEEAPLVSGRRVDKDGKEYIFLGDQLYVGRAQEKTDQQKKYDATFLDAAEKLAAAVEKDSGGTEEIRSMIAMVVRATATPADWYDHLPGDYVRKVVAEGYTEDNIPGSGERLKKELAEFRDAYRKITEPFLNFQGDSANGEAIEYRTYDDHAVWRLYDKQKDMTTFCVKNPDDEKDCLFILYDWPGKVADMPDINTAKKVRMTHQAVGVTAEYDPASGKMTYDPAKWELAAELELPVLPEEYRKEKGYGKPGWSLPPHVLLVDKLANTIGIVTPYGRFDVQDFNKIKDEGERKKAMDAFLNQLNVVLPHKPEGSYLHLYYRYCFEYILDSPVTDHPNLLGSRTHCGDIHQTTYQSLQRFMGGRYVGDCDDLAEFFMDLTRKTGHLSYVMSLPSHAACGWAEKAPHGSEWEFYVLDTGPPRKFTDRNLDKVVEMTSRAYDSDGTMRFDPKSMGFLFRFNGEPTRTPYYLSTRMFTDPEYAEIMERVQSYWHFHFYALGIETMLDRIEKKGDHVPENCNEVAGLYGQVREVEKSIHWSQESIKQMKNEERLSRMSENFRIASMWRTEHDNEKCYEAIKSTVAELNEVRKNTQESLNFIGMRLQVMGLLDSVDHPWDGWKLIKPDIELLNKIGRLKLEHAASLTTCYLKMKDMVGNRKVLTSAELKQMTELGRVLDGFYGNGKQLFEEEDDINEYMRKYAFVSMYYAAKFGRKKYLEEMLKDGPYPDPAQKRDHADRHNPQAEDWKWIRLSLASYSTGIGDAIDFDDPPEKWRIAEAVKLCDQMIKAGKEASKFGSLGNLEFALMSTRVLRAFLVKDWKDLEEVIKETSKRDWAKLTSDIAETFGRGARFVTPEEFTTQYRMFTKYITSKPSFFTVLYEAFRADGFAQAVAATQVALELNPKDEDMKREAVYLKQLADRKLAEMKIKESGKKAETEKASKESATPKETSAVSKPDARIGK